MTDPELQIVNPGTRRFYDHWRSLRRRDARTLVPHTEDYLDAAPVALMPCTFIQDVLDDGLLVRFMGTELVARWRHDSTGQMFGGNLDAAGRQRLISIAKAIITHPCGVLQHGAVTTSAGRTTEFEALLLPLAANTPHPPRLVVYSASLATMEREEHSSRFTSAGTRAWVDIGVGVPAFNPPE